MNEDRARPIVGEGRCIAHVDMDAFYASVELLRYPVLRGRAVVVGGRRRVAPSPGAAFALLRDYVGRGVATTATYEARALGVHSGMGLMKAARLAPDAILLPADFDAYRQFSGRFKQAVRAISPKIEDRGIDEIYVELTDLVGTGAEGAGWARARELAEEIRRAVREATGLSCSVGIAPNKLLAKIASDLEKPGGLTIVHAGDLRDRIWPLAARRITGIGPKSDARLEALGIRTIGDLATADPELLVDRFGARYGAWMHRAAWGLDDRPVVTSSEPKSISRETTFERDLHAVRDRAALSRIFTDLCVKVAADLADEGYAGRTIGVKLRYDNFRTVTRERTLDAPLSEAADIRRAAGECLKRVPLERRIRLLGVRVGTLSKAEDAPPRA